MYYDDHVTNRKIKQFIELYLKKEEELNKYEIEKNTNQSDNEYFIKKNKLETFKSEIENFINKKNQLYLQFKFAMLQYEKLQKKHNSVYFDSLEINHCIYPVKSIFSIKQCNIHTDSILCTKHLKLYQEPNTSEVISKLFERKSNENEYSALLNDNSKILDKINEIIYKSLKKHTDYESEYYIYFVEFLFLLKLDIDNIKQIQNNQYLITNIENSNDNNEIDDLKNKWSHNLSNWYDYRYPSKVTYIINWEKYESHGGRGRPRTSDYILVPDEIAKSWPKTLKEWKSNHQPSIPISVIDWESSIKSKSIDYKLIPIENATYWPTNKENWLEEKMSINYVYVIDWEKYNSHGGRGRPRISDYKLVSKKIAEQWPKSLNEWKSINKMEKQIITELK